MVFRSVFGREDLRNSKMNLRLQWLLLSMSLVEEVLRNVQAEVGPEVRHQTSVGNRNDVLLKKDEVDELIRRRRSDRKRKQSISSNSSFRLWTLPVRFMFDGNHDDGQKQVIRDALQHWADNTCVRFEEIHRTVAAEERSFTDHYVLFTRQPLGCFSHTGLVRAIPQRVNLDDECLKTFGKPVHEIGHVLGLWHEQQRTDRDTFVRVIQKNIGKFKNQFSRHWEVPEDIPYELGSVMHYTAKDGSKNGRMTLRAKDPMFQRNMGQRTGVSFGDAKCVNAMYCRGSCGRRLERPCEFGGYQDPNSCDQCKCPEGFSGPFCQDIAPPVNANCGGIFKVVDGETLSIETPGFGDRGRSKPHYKPHTSCTWWFKGQHPGLRLQVEFLDAFGVFCSADESCYHWVEVRYRKNLAKEGPRFCCYSRPEVRLTSETNELMVIFRSNWTITEEDEEEEEEDDDDDDGEEGEMDEEEEYRLFGFKARITSSFVSDIKGDRFQSPGLTASSPDHLSSAAEPTASAASSSDHLSSSAQPTVSAVFAVDAATDPEQSAAVTMETSSVHISTLKPRDRK